MDEQRIGRRAVVDVPALWEPMVPIRLKGIRRRYLAREPVRVVDLSVTGASVLGSAHELLRPGVAMSMDFAHGRGLVKIRQVRCYRDDGSASFGVSFLEMDDQLRAAVNDTVGGRQLVDWRWRMVQ